MRIKDICKLDSITLPPMTKLIIITMIANKTKQATQEELYEMLPINRQEMDRFARYPNPYLKMDEKGNLHLS